MNGFALKHYNLHKLNFEIWLAICFHLFYFIYTTNERERRDKRKYLLLTYYVPGT